MPWSVLNYGTLSLHQRNNLIYLENKDRPLEELRAEAQGVFTDLLQALETLSDVDLNDPGQFPGMPPELATLEADR